MSCARSEGSMVRKSSDSTTWSPCSVSTTRSCSLTETARPVIIGTVALRWSAVDGIAASAEPADSVKSRDTHVASPLRRRLNGEVMRRGSFPVGRFLPGEPAGAHRASYRRRGLRTFCARPRSGATRCSSDGGEGKERAARKNRRPVATKEARGAPREPPVKTLDQPLVHHRVGDLEEARDVGAVHEIPRRAVALRGFERVLVDRDHDLVKPLVDLFTGPRQAHAVLRHLETRGRDASGIGGLGGAVEDTLVEEAPRGLG